MRTGPCLCFQARKSQPAQNFQAQARRRHQGSPKLKLSRQQRNSILDAEKRWHFSREKSSKYASLTGALVRQRGKKEVVCAPTAG